MGNTEKIKNNENKIEIPIFSVIYPEIITKKNPLRFKYFNTIKLTDKMNLVVTLAKYNPMLFFLKPSEPPIYCWNFNITLGKSNLAACFSSIASECFVCRSNSYRDLEKSYIDGLEWFLNTINKMSKDFTNIPDNIDVIV